MLRSLILVPVWVVWCVVGPQLERRPVFCRVLCVGAGFPQSWLLARTRFGLDCSYLYGAASVAYYHPAQGVGSAASLIGRVKGLFACLGLQQVLREGSSSWDA